MDTADVKVYMQPTNLRECPERITFYYNSLKNE
jgi:hypothetical protein